MRDSERVHKNLSRLEEKREIAWQLLVSARICYAELGLELEKLEKGWKELQEATEKVREMVKGETVSGQQWGREE